MKVLGRICIGLAVCALLGLVATFPLESSFASRAKKVQRVQIDAASSLFDEAGVPIGTPQEMIIDDPKAFLGKKDESGAELVSENYLQEKGIYPLQLQTVRFLMGNARIGLGIGAVAFAVAGLLLVRKRRITS